MSENLTYVHMHQSGPIPLPGMTGWYSGGQTITVDLDTMQVVDQTPLAQRAYDASPLVEPAQEEAPAQPEPIPEPVQPELVPTPEPAPIEAAPEPIAEQVVDATPAQEDAPSVQGEGA